MSFSSFLVVVAIVSAAAEPPDETARVDAWRKKQDAKMRAVDSPLARLPTRNLVQGHNTLGSGTQDRLRFERPGIPPSAADFVLQNGSVYLDPLLPMILVNGQPAAAGPLQWGDKVTLEPLTLTLQGTAGGAGFVVSDASTPRMMHYKGLRYLAVDGRYRVPASFTPAEQGRTLTVDTSTGGQRAMNLLGTLHFNLEGKDLSLDAFSLGDHPGELFVVFKDPTNGKETYPAGRFVVVPGPVDGKTTVDFNLAWNPLCAYSDSFNCPLSPAQNRLPVRIPVGEASYPHE